MHIRKHANSVSLTEKGKLYNVGKKQRVIWGNYFQQ